MFHRRAICATMEYYTVEYSMVALNVHLWNIPPWKLHVFGIFHRGMFHSCVMEPSSSFVSCAKFLFQEQSMLHFLSDLSQVTPTSWYAATARSCSATSLTCWTTRSWTARRGSPAGVTGPPVRPRLAASPTQVRPSGNISQQISVNGLTWSLLLLIPTKTSPAFKYTTTHRPPTTTIQYQPSIRWEILFCWKSFSFTVCFKRSDISASVRYTGGDVGTFETYCKIRCPASHDLF